MIDLGERVHIANPNARDETPGERALHQEFGLLAVLDVPIAKVMRPDRLPIDPAKFVEIRIVFEECGPGIGRRKCPSVAILLGPRHRLVEVGLQKQNWALTARVGEPRRIACDVTVFA